MSHHELAGSSPDVSGPHALPRRRVGALEAVVATPQDAAHSIARFASEYHPDGLHVHLVNAYTVALADKDGEYRKVLSEDALNFPDGKPLSWISKLRRDSPHLHQVRGPQFFLDVMNVGRQFELKHYLLGSTTEVLERIRENLESSYPGVNIVGAESPPFRPLSAEEIEAQDGRVTESGASIVWVGLGTPKQDRESARIAAALPITAIAVGAAFDFAAGTLREAPAWMRACGLEWLFRLSREPRRLWRRYLFGNARFVRSVVLARSSSDVDASR